MESTHVSEEAFFLSTTDDMFSFNVEENPVPLSQDEEVAEDDAVKDVGALTDPMEEVVLSDASESDSDFDIPDDATRALNEGIMAV